MSARAEAILTSILAIAALAACSSDSPSGNDTGDPPGIQTNVTTPEAALDAHAQAMNARDFDAYQAMMEPIPPGREAAGFRFYIRDDDAGEFPWLPDTWWGYDVESQILRNMTDPEYDGEERPVETIEFEYRIIHELVVEDGRLLTADADITVLVGANTGWLANTRFLFLLVEDADGYYRIRSIREKKILEPAPHPSLRVEESSWGSIKNLYLN
jgi:hypothetical protein